MSELDTGFLLDAGLAIAYLLVAAGCFYWGSRSKASLSAIVLLGAYITFIAGASAVLTGIDDYWAHILISGLCAIWALAIIDFCDSYLTAVIVLGMCAFNLFCAGESFLFNGADTSLSESRWVVALCFHMAILASTVTNGIFTLRGSDGNSNRSVYQSS